MRFELPKGTRDFLPEEKILRDCIINTLKETFELYGYNTLETPALEMYETLSSKYAGGSEILKEIYTLTDNAKRKLALRYDLTVPLARVIASNPALKKPFKRYQIDRVWRDGPIKLGRYREFWQCDADVIGIKSMLADAELLALANSFFKKINLDVTICVNNRKLLNSILDIYNIQKEKQESIIITLDKIKKIGIKGVAAELKKKNISDKAIKALLELFNAKNKDDYKLIDKLDKLLKEKEGINEIKELLYYCKEFNLDNVKLEISMARGLSYYTGTVFEIFINNGSLSCSLAAGGRFDSMISNFMNSREEVPAVGISFGLDTLMDAVTLNKKIQLKKSTTLVYIIPIDAKKECIKIAKSLRDQGIKCDMDLVGRSITKNLEYVNKLNIPYALIIGSDELKQKKLKLKDMASGKEKLLNIEVIFKELKKQNSD